MMKSNCISLGWFCGTASAMGYYGLRSHSGPFDWFFSDFEAVLKIMETDFTDFMKKENLILDENNEKVFHDKKYGFCCNHDINEDFETEYPLIYRKYMHRAERFQQDVKEPTCFIRAVKSETELQFIKENEEYISKVITRGNQNNQIIFLTLKNMYDISDRSRFLFFQLGMTRYVGEFYEMRTMFDSSDALVKYCRKNILPEEIIVRNIDFDRKNLSAEKRSSIFERKINEGKCNILPVLEEYYSDIKSGIFLFGGGHCGEIILRYLLRNNVKVRAIIDNDSGKTGSFWEGVPVIPLSKVEQRNPNILVSVYSNKVAEEISAQIVEKIPNARVYKLYDLVCHPDIILML